MADLTQQGFNRGRGLKQPQVREDTLSLGPSVEYYDDLLNLTDAQIREGQVRLAVQEGNMYYRWNGAWQAISPLNLYGFRQVDVADIDNPVEMAEEVPRGQEREIVVARQDDGAATVYRFDFGAPEAGAASPYSIASVNADGFWSAMGGRYQSGGRSILADSAQDGIYVTGQGSEPSVWLAGLLQYDVATTWDSGNPGNTLSSYVPSISVPVIYDGAEYNLVLWTASEEEAEIPGSGQPEQSSIAVALNSGALSAFTPLDITGIQLWIDAQDEATYTETAGKVSGLQNKANGSKNLSQGAASNRPLKVADSFDVRITGVSFTSPAYMIDGTGWTGGSELLVAMVFKNDRLLNGFGIPDGLLTVALSSTNYFSLGTQSSGAFTAAMGTFLGAESLTEATSVPIGTTSVVYAYFSGSGGTKTIFHNGNENSTALVYNPSIISPSAVLSIGRQWRSGSLTDYAEGDIGDVVYVNSNTVISSATRDNLVNYLKFKYGASF